MSGPTVSSGTRLEVSIDLPATYDAAGFGALTWVQIRGARTVGDIGNQFQTQANNPIGGTPHNRRAGPAIQSLALELIRIADAGQAILRDAINEDVVYSYRLTQPDGMRLCLTAQASSRMHGGFASGSIADTKMMLEINCKVVEV